MKILTVFSFLTVVCYGQVLNDKTGKSLDSIESASVWSRVRSESQGGHKKRLTRKIAGQISPSQAPGVVEVVDSGRGQLAVTFITIKEMAPQTVLAFEMVLPDGTEVPLSALRFDQGLPGTGYIFSLWNGPFPSMWQPGDTTFVVGVVTPSGQIKYSTGTIRVNNCCGLSGPVDRADVSEDGAQVNLTGFFDGDTFATVDGVPTAIVISFSPVNGGSVGSVTPEFFNQGQHVVCVCSQGQCSTRVIYKTTVLPTPPPIPVQ